MLKRIFKQTGQTSEAKAHRLVVGRESEDDGGGLNRLPPNLDLIGVPGQNLCNPYTRRDLHGQTSLNITEAHNVDASHSTFTNVQGNIINYPTTINPDDKRTKILRWLSPVIPSPSYNEACGKRVQETGKWFLMSERFSQWKSKAGSLLWIYGKPGCGKTVLSSTIIKSVSNCCTSAQQACGYFFFDARDSQKGLQRYEDMLRSLIWQFSTPCDGLPRELHDLYDQCTAGVQQPTVENLRSTFFHILARFQDVYLIIDALDECADQVKLLHWIKETVTAKVGNLHLLATSRQERDIETRLHVLNPLSICLEGDEVEQDIATYLDQMLRDDDGTMAWNKDDVIRDHVKSSLLQGAQGMFRWVALQLEELQLCLSRHEVEEQLLHLPKDLNESYDRMISRIDERRHDDARKLFQWLAFSIRPLDLVELAEVVAVDFFSKDRPWFNRHRRYYDARDVLRVCAGFVSITEGTVKLAHFSVKEYLLSSRLLQLAPSFRISETASHSHISKTCLAYLAQFNHDPLDENRLEECPLAYYAAEHWITHAKSGDVDNSPDLQQLATDIFQQPTAFANWIRLWDMDFGPCHACLRHPSHYIAPPLYYASMASLENVVKVLLKNNADVNARGGLLGNALHAACSRGSGVIVRLLLENGADTNAETELLMTPLRLAAMRGDEGIVKSLLENGADTWAHGTNALCAACYHGHRSVVRLLLEVGVDVNEQERYGDYALHNACHGGHEDVARLLLEAGADINARGWACVSALQAACVGGHEAVARLILKHGADIHAVGGPSGNINALQAAARAGSEAITKLLLQNGADVNMQGKEDGSALQAAACGGSETTVRLLLNAGADVNAQGGHYGGALQAASHCGFESIVKLLLANGADINSGGLYGNALAAAAFEGHESVVRLLLEHNADINALGGPFGTALEVAASRKHDAVVKLLLQHGADPNAHCGTVATALSSACYRDSDTLAKLLLAHGADINARGEFGTALHAAASMGSKANVKLLIESGADVNVRAGMQGHPLHAAVDSSFNPEMDHQRDSVFMLLLDAGADVNAQGGQYFSALQAACLRTPEAIVKVLIDRGADINAQGGKYGNALQAACDRGNEAIVKLLVEKGADVAAQGGPFGTALQAASSDYYSASVFIVKLLLSSGADVNAGGGYYGNALQAASFGGRADIVQLLLDSGADINAQGGEYGTALIAATAGCRDTAETIMKLLLDNGADVNVQGDAWGHALLRAGTSFRKLQLLLEHGADVNVHWCTTNCATALQSASHLGCPQVVELLLQAGADIDFEGGFYGTALQAASHSGFYEVVKLLLAKGANINAQGGHFCTALQAASSSGHRLLVKLLLECGADVNVQGGEHGNALQAASSFGDVAIMKLLLENGAEPVNGPGINAG